MTINYELQTKFWDAWNANTREKELPEISLQQARLVDDWLNALGRKDLRILEVGCGAGWLSAYLTSYGKVVGIDLSTTVLTRAQGRWPDVKFLSGDFLTYDFQADTFDVVVALEVLSHVEDQRLFFQKTSELLNDNGLLILATQNRPVLEKHCNIPPPGVGQIRKWVDRSELTDLASRYFHVETIQSITPIAQKGYRRILTSKKVNTFLEQRMGIGLRSLLEARDWGWTLMLRGRKRPKPQYSDDTE